MSPSPFVGGIYKGGMSSWVSHFLYFLGHVIRHDRLVHQLLPISIPISIPLPYRKCKPHGMTKSGSLWLSHVIRPLRESKSAVFVPLVVKICKMLGANQIHLIPGVYKRQINIPKVGEIHAPIGKMGHYWYQC